MSDEKPKKNLGGQPTKFRPEYVEQGRKLCELGAIDQELANFFEVEIMTINRWKLAHPEFGEALKVGKSMADERVKRALYERAISGSDTAAIFWLKNRDPANWRDRQAHELSGPDGQPIQNKYIVEFVHAQPEGQRQIPAPALKIEAD